MPYGPVVFVAKRGADIPAQAAVFFTRLTERLYVSGAAPDHRMGAQIFSSWGAGTVGGTFIGQSSHLPMPLQVRSPARLAENIAGSLTLLTWTPDGVVDVLPDPIGNGLVFASTNAIGTLISPDLGGLAAAARELGSPLQKSALYPLSYLVTGAPGGGGLVDCSYEGVTVVPAFHHVTCSNDGVATRQYPALEGYWADDGRSWEDGVELVAEDIAQHVAAAARASADRHVSHLTGGLDSRTVFAGLQSIQDDAFVFSCNGGPTLPDKKVALGLAATYGATMTNYTGLNFWLVPETAEQAEIWPIVETHGMIRTRPTPFSRRQPTLLLAGGCGEFMRTQPNGPSAAPTCGRKAALAKWGALGFSEDPDQRLLTERSMEAMVRPIDRVFVLAQEYAIPNEYWAELFYMLHRNRYFVGQISSSWSAYVDRFDPLYSLESVRTSSGKIVHLLEPGPSNSM